MSEQFFNGAWHKPLHFEGDELGFAEYGGGFGITGSDFACKRMEKALEQGHMLRLKVVGIIEDWEK